ncbi:alpha/beta hydrolase family esterase [Mucilaginibacter sp. HD30]
MKMITNFISLCICLTMLSCGKDDPKPAEYHFSEQVVVDGIRRTYMIKLPQNYYQNDSTRAMVIGLHGTGGSADQFEKAYGFDQKADQAGFIAVYPDGVQKEDGLGIFKVRTWNAGTCCDFAMYTHVDDVKFISTLIDNISSRFHINRKKIYVTGMSNGGMMAYRLASELPSKIAAVGIVSATMVAPKEASKQGIVPIIHIHSALDTKVPVAGGTGIGDYNFPPVMEGINYWVERDHCLTDPLTEQHQGYDLKSWKNSAGNILIQYYLTEDGGHAWPSSTVQGRMGDTPSTVVNATNLIWDFCNQYTLP